LDFFLARLWARISILAFEIGGLGGSPGSAKTPVACQTRAINRSSNQKKAQQARNEPWEYDTEAKQFSKMGHGNA